MRTWGEPVDSEAFCWFLVSEAKLFKKKNAKENPRMIYWRPTENWVNIVSALTNVARRKMERGGKQKVNSRSPWAMSSGRGHLDYRHSHPIKAVVSYSSGFFSSAEPWLFSPNVGPLWVWFPPWFRRSPALFEQGKHLMSTFKEYYVYTNSALRKGGKRAMDCQPHYLCQKISPYWRSYIQKGFLEWKILVYIKKDVFNHRSYHS